MKSRLVTCALMSLIVLCSACKHEDNRLPEPPASQNGRMMAKVDGVSFQSKEIGTLSGTASGSFIMSAKDDHDNSVTITAPAAVGTFNSSTNNDTSRFYTSSDGGLWFSSMGNGTAPVTITKYDVSTKKMPGNFSFTALASGWTNATGTKTITNGSFTDVSFVVQ